jgi:hypothetical protein
VDDALEFLERRGVDVDALRAGRTCQEQRREDETGGTRDHEFLEIGSQWLHGGRTSGPEQGQYPSVGLAGLATHHHEPLEGL